MTKPMRHVDLTELEAFNLQWIARYIDQEKRGVSKGRRNKIKYTLGKLGRLHLNKRFDEVTKDELQEFVDSLKDDTYSDPDHPDGYEQSTKTTYLKIAKPFFAWMHKIDDPSFASWIRSGNYHTTVGPEDILTEAQLNQMRSTCKTPRDRAMLETLYESALRPKEFLGLRKSDIEFEKEDILIHIRKGKTGFPRDILLVGNARPLITQWILNEHPLRNDSDFSLWVDMSSNSKTHDPLQQQGLREFVNRIAEEGKVKDKRVIPYMMRHTRLTDLARIGANEALLCNIAGWKQGSEMASNYVHLSGRDQKPALMKLYGIQPEEARPFIQLPKKCPNCNEVSPFEAKACWKCKFLFDPAEQLKMMESNSEMKRELEEMRAFRKQTQEFIQRMSNLSLEEAGDGLARVMKKKRDKEDKEVMKEIESRDPIADNRELEELRDEEEKKRKNSQPAV